MSKEKKQEAVTEKTAEQVVEETKRIAKCQSEIERILKENKCQLDASVLLRAGQIIPQINIIAL